MRANMTIEKLSEVLVTMRLTMPLKEWQELQSQLGKAYPAWQLSGAITDMVSQMTRVLYPQMGNGESE